MSDILVNEAVINSQISFFRKADIENRLTKHFFLGADTFDIFRDGSCLFLWKLDGDFKSGARDYNGSPHYVTFEDTPMGKAAVFDGQSGIWCGGSHYFYTLKSVSFWMKVREEDKNNDFHAVICFSYYNYNTSSSYHFRAGFDENGNLRLWSRQFNADGGLSKEFFSPENTVLFDGRWHHYVITLRDDLLYFFRDAEQIGNYVHAFHFFEGNAYCKIGYDYSGHRFIGSLKQIRVFNRGLSDKEVGILYNNLKLLQKG